MKRQHFIMMMDNVIWRTEQSIEFGGGFTCLKIDRALPEFLAEAYHNYLRVHLDHGHFDECLSNYRGDCLSMDEAYLRRLLVLESFKREILDTHYYKLDAPRIF